MSKQISPLKEKPMSDELHQCPCCKATKCVMDEPCLGCETYAAWRTRAEPEYRYKNFQSYYGNGKDVSSVDKFERKSAQAAFNAARERKEG